MAELTLVQVWPVPNLHHCKFNKGRDHGRPWEQHPRQNRRSYGADELAEQRCVSPHLQRPDPLRTVPGTYYVRVGGAGTRGSVTERAGRGPGTWWMT